MTFDPREPVGPSQQDLRVETESLGGFRLSVADRLENMQEAGLGPAIAEEFATRPEQFGVLGMLPRDFAKQYEVMRGRLADFIRFQQEAMEALGILARLSERDFESLEADQLARLREIMDGWQEAQDTQQARETRSGGSGGGGRDMKA